MGREVEAVKKIYLFVIFKIFFKIENPHLKRHKWKFVRVFFKILCSSISLCLCVSSIPFALLCLVFRNETSLIWQIFSLFF